MRSGWTKFYRSWLDDPLINKDPDHLSVWVRLVNDAAIEPIPGDFGGKRITLQPGQLTTGRKQLGERCGVQQSKVERILRSFENAQLIEQRASSKNRLISMVFAAVEQGCEQQNEHQVNSNRTTSEQQVNTHEELRPKTEEGYSSEFLAFWDAYPVKKDKKRSAAKYAAALKSGAKPDVILAGLERARKSEQWRDSKYIPLASTWLNGARWEDETDTPPTQECASGSFDGPRTNLINGVVHFLDESGKWVPAEGDNYE